MEVSGQLQKSDFFFQYLHPKNQTQVAVHGSRSPCMAAGHRAWQQAHLPMSHLINVRAKAGMWLQWAHVHGRALT